MTLRLSLTERQRYVAAVKSVLVAVFCETGLDMSLHVEAFVALVELIGNQRAKFGNADLEANRCVI